MKHKKARIALAFSLIMLMLGMMLFPQVSKAYLDTETWLSNYEGHMENGVARGLIVTRNDEGEVFPYLRIGEDPVENGFLIYNNKKVIDAALDGYGMVNILRSDKTVVFWSYDLFPEEISARDYNLVPNTKDPKGYMNDIESFVFKGTGENAVIVGYKSVSGEVYPLPSLDEMKEAAGSDSPLEPRYIPGDGTLNPEETPGIETPKPSPTVLPSTPTPIVTPSEEPSEAPSMEPTSVPTPTEEPSEAPPTPTTKPTSTGEPSEIPTTAPTTVPTSPISPTQAPFVSSSPTSAPSNSTMTNPPNETVQPTVTPSVSKKLTVKTSKKKGITTYSLCEGDKTLIQYALKKGKLTWKVDKKKGNAKGIKYAGFIKKSKNLFYMDKKGKGYTISSKNGKKKLIIKKGAKKPIYSDKFITKVKIASKSVDISNK